VSRSKNTTETKPNQPNALQRYIRETRGEVRKITWPTREEAWRLTAVVLGVTLASAIFFWFWDSIFSNGINLLIQAMVGA
jgi:preprotein translocase subunit SecE